MYSQALIDGKDLPLGEALSMGGQTTVIGLGIVFGVLIILMIVLMLFKVIFYKDSSKQSSIEAANAAVEKTEEIVKTETADETDEEELIAVLTAAVAASLNTSTYNLRIKSYRRTDTARPAWNRAGLADTMNNRF